MHKSLPTWIGFAILLVYLALSAVLFSMTFDQGLVDSIFFCFFALATIGLWDEVFHQASKGSPDLVFVMFCTVYLFVGLAIVAMCLGDLLGVKGADLNVCSNRRSNEQSSHDAKLSRDEDDKEDEDDGS